MTTVGAREWRQPERGHTVPCAPCGVLGLIVLCVAALLVGGGGCHRRPPASSGARLAITALSPGSAAATAQVESTSVLVTCKTSLPAACRVLIWRADQATPRRAPGSTTAPGSAPGTALNTTHRLEVTGLEPGYEYVFFVEATAEAQTVHSEEHRLAVARLQALVFVDHAPRFAIRRDYDQRGTVQVKNIDNRAHAVRLVTREVPADLVAGFLGPGSEDQATPTVLEPGEMREFRLMLYAPGAKERAYRFKLALRNLEHPEPEAVFDLAQADVTVQFPSFDLALAPDESQRDPRTLALPVTVTNRGEALSDLTLALDGALAEAAALTPGYAECPLRAGQAVRVTVAPILRPGFTKLEGVLVARAAGQEQRLHLSFAAPAGQRVYLAFGDPVTSDMTHGGGCTNKGRHDTPGGSGTGPGGNPPPWFPPGGGGPGETHGEDPDPPTAQPDDNDDALGVSSRHRITRPALLALLPSLTQQSVEAPARIVRPPLTYTAWHAPAGAGQQIFVSLEPHPGVAVAVTRDSFLNQWPDLAVGDQGRLLVVWERHHPDGQTEITFALGSPEGAQWSAAAALAPPKVDLYNPILVPAPVLGGAGGFYAIWQDGNEFAWRMTTSNGADWRELPPIRPAAGARVWWHHLVVGRTGGLVLCHAQQDGAGKRIVARRSGDGGTSWSPAAALSTPGDVGEPNALALPGGALLVVWRQDGRIAGTRSDDGGATWTPPVLLTAPATSAELPIVWLDTAGELALTYLTTERNCLRSVRRPLSEKLELGPAAPDQRDATFEALLGRVALGLGPVTGTIRPGAALGKSGALTDLTLSGLAQPLIVKDAQATRFFWHQTTGGNGRVMFAAVGADHKLRVSPRAINPVATPGIWPTAVVLPDGKLAAAFVTGAGQVALQTSDTGETWGAPALIGRKAAAPALAAASDGTLALAWVEEDRRLQVRVGTNPATISDASARQPAALARDAAGRWRVVFAGREGGLWASSSADGKAWAAPQQVASSGAAPCLWLARDGVLWLASQAGPGQVEVRRSAPGQLEWGPAEPAAKAPGYAEQPSLLDSPDGPCLAFHSPSRNERYLFDTVFLAAPAGTAGDPGTSGTVFGEPRRTLCLARNLNRVFLTLNFALKHERRIYQPFETNIFVNGHLLHTILDRIPEGRYLFPVSPSVLNYTAFGPATNWYTLKVDRLNRAHYIMAYDFALLTDYRFTQRYVFAESQAAADAQLRSAEAGANHDQSNIGVYANALDAVPATPQPGQQITLKVYVFNVGMKPAENVRVRAFADVPKLDASGAFTGDPLTGVMAVGTVPPLDGRTVEVKFPYPAGLLRAYTAAWSSDQDFDLSDNVQGTTFTIPEAESPLAGLRQTDLSPRCGVDLEVRAGGQPVAPDHVAVAFFPSGNRLQPVLEADGAGHYQLRPFTYDVRVRYLMALEPVEVWAPGLKVEEGKPAQAKVDLPVAGIDFEFAPKHGETAQVRFYPAGVRGGAAEHTLTAAVATHAVQLPAGRYDLRLTLTGAAAIEKWIAGLDLQAGQRVKTPVALEAGAVAVQVPEPPSDQNVFRYYVTAYDAATGRCVLADAPGAKPLWLAAGKYDLLVSHPFGHGEPLNLEEWHRGVEVQAGALATVDAPLPVARFHITPQNQNGGHIVRVNAELYRAGDHSRAMYSVDCDKDATVARGKYDLYCAVGPRQQWTYDVDPSRDRNVVVSVPNGLITFDLSSAPGGALAEIHSEVLILPHLRQGEGSAMEAVQRLYPNPRLRSYSVGPGDYDLRLRFTGYGPDALRWFRGLSIGPGQERVVQGRVELGFLAVDRPGPGGADLKSEVFLYPAQDRVKRLDLRAEQRPIYLSEEVAVIPGVYDVLVRDLKIAPGLEQWVTGVFVAAGDHRELRLPAAGALALKLTQPGGLGYRHVVGVVLDRVGANAGPFSATQRMVDLASAAGAVVSLPPGFYDVTPALSGIVVESARQSNVEVAPGRLADLAAEVPGGEIEVTARLPDGAPAGNWVWVRLVPAEAALSGLAALSSAGAGVFRGVVPAGTYHVLATAGEEVWAAPATIQQGRTAKVDLVVEPARLAVRATRADGAIVTPTLEVFRPGATGASLLKVTDPYTRLLRAGTYDLKLALPTGETRWRRGVTLQPGATFVQREEFPARNLIVAAKNPALNRAGAGLLVLVFPKGPGVSAVPPLGWFALGSGATLPAGEYDLLLAASDMGRDGIWKRGVTVGPDVARVEWDVDAGLLLVDTAPHLTDAQGDPAATVRVCRAGTDETVAQVRLGEAAALPAGRYDLVLQHEGVYGKIGRRIPDVPVEPALCSAPLIWLWDDLGTVRVHALSPSAREAWLHPTVRVRRGDTPAALTATQGSSAPPPRQHLPGNRSRLPRTPPPRRAS